MLLGRETKWWQNEVVYQIYPRSFQDGNGDGIGDLRGIISRLDYLAELGVGILWLSPIYKSPQDDNGYDISDYQDIDPLFGTLADFDELLAGAKQRGIRVVMDLVVNHSSDEHAWFEESRSSRTNPKADWYIWRDPKPDGSAPNNWGSFFSGSAWQFDEIRQQYFLHLFSKKQPDLNWENPEVRTAVHQMMNWWLDRGVSGFRMDVINLISKVPSLPDGEQYPGDEFGNGFPFTANGPRLTEWLREMNEAVMAGREEVMTVGECPGLTLELAREITDIDQHLLDMCFHFEHMSVDQGASKWDRKPLKWTAMKSVLGRWQEALAERGWNSLYWDNHDQPRAVSRFGDDTEYRVLSAKALATLLHLHRGTPYIYQGEELGMTNFPFADISQFRDLETLNHFRTVKTSGGDEVAAMAGYRFVGRDNARTPMQWDDSESAGFTTSEPWIAVNPNYPEINAKSNLADSDSVFHHYQHLIQLRKSDPVIAVGDFQMLLPDDEELYVIVRRLGDEGVLALINCSSTPTPMRLPLDPAWSNARLVSHNYADEPLLSEISELRPWQALVYRW